MHLKVDSPSREHEKYNCVDLNTNVKIPLVQEANDETGEFSCFVYDQFTEDLVRNKENTDYVLFKFKGNIKLIKKE